MVIRQEYYKTNGLTKRSFKLMKKQKKHSSAFHMKENRMEIYLKFIEPLDARSEVQSVNITSKWRLPVLLGPTEEYQENRP